MTEKQLSDPICGNRKKQKSEHYYFKFCNIMAKDSTEFTPEPKKPNPAPEAPNYVTGLKAEFEIARRKRGLMPKYKLKEDEAPPVGSAQKGE